MLRWITAIKVRERLLILGLGVVVAFTALNLYQFRDFRLAQQTVDDLYARNFATTVAIKDTHYAVSQITTASIALASEAILFDDGKQKILRNTRGDGLVIGLYGAWRNWNEHYHDTHFTFSVEIAGETQEIEETVLVEQLKQQVGRFITLLKELETAIEETDEDDFEASDISPITNQMAYLGVELNQTLAQAVMLETAKIKKIQADFKATLAEDQRLVFWIMIAVSIFAVFAMLVLAKTISSPLQQLQSALAAFLETGDLNQKINIHQQDEIGDLANHFNEFIEKLARIIRNVKENAQVLLDASGHLSTAADTMNDETQLAAQQVHGIAGVIGEMNDHVEQARTGTVDVRENTLALTAAIDKMGGAMNQIHQITAQASNISAEAVTKLTTANQQISQLEQTSQQVVRIVSTIEHIADNCKMLALNAGIEAVRVGEAGKGFIVVANEVKNLSKQTSDEVAVVSEHIQSMVDATNHTRKAAQSVSQTIQTLSKNNQTIAQEVSRHLDQTQQIMRTSQLNAGSLSTVTERVAQTTTLFRKVADDRGGHEANITKLLQKVDAVSGQVTIVRDDAKQLYNLAQKLDALVADFHVSN